MNVRKGASAVAQLGVAEASHRLGLSQDTVRRKLKTGELAGEKIAHAGGFRWLVDVPEVDPEPPAPHANGRSDTDALRELVDTLQEQLTARTREVAELHQLLAARALEGPGNQPWWAFWRR